MSSRYRVLAQPTAAPGHCFISGETGGEHGPYIDTGVTVRPNSAKGAVYISRNTIIEMYNELRKFEGVNPDLKYTENDLKEAKDAGYETGYFEGSSDVKEKFNEFVSSIYSVPDPVSDSGDSSSPESKSVREDSAVEDERDASIHGSSGKDNATPSSKKRGSVSCDPVHESTGDDSSDGLGLNL